MQVQNSQSVQPITPLSINQPEDNQQPSTLKIEEGIQVSISEKGQQLNASKNEPPVNMVPVEPETLPILSGEKLEQAVQFKKAQMHYQAVADISNIAMGNNQGISASSAYYLSQNEDARELVLQTKSQQQTLANMQTYQQQTNAINDQYV